MVDGKKSKGFEDLEVWQESAALVEQVYELTSGFPKDEVYNLTSQIRRCAVSVAANNAEGAARKSDRDFARFLVIANGSLAELKSHLLLAGRLSLAPEIQQLIDGINILGRRLKKLRSVIIERDVMA